MYARAKWLLSSLLVLLFSVSVAGAQQYGQARPAFAQQQLDQMLAPVALYPDALLSQILMAATYPGEVVEAARWSRSNSDLNGDRAVRAAERIDWDPSVKSLVAFPQILAMMDEKLDWTEDLGDAFLDQREQVMDTVQYLRSQAYSAGNLSSSDQFRVDRQDSTFSITFTNAEMAYVPYYDPMIVYGTWWWPAYRPVYWSPWPGYHARPGFARGYAWGPGIAVSRGFFFGAPDWRRRTVNIVNVNNYYYRPAHVNARASVAAGAPHAWQHDTAHRRDFPRRDASLRQPRAEAAPEARRDVREHDASPRHERSVSVNAPAPAQAEARTAPERSANIRSQEPRGQETRGFERRGAAAPAAPAQPEVRSAPVQPNTAESAPRGAPERSANTRSQEPRGHDSRGFERHGSAAPAAPAQPEARGHDSRGFDGRGESPRRPETRVDSGNRPAHPQAVAGVNHRPAERAPVVAPVAPPVASQPQVHSAPVQAQAAPARPAAEQRPAGGREREHANNRPAPAAAADNNAPAQNSGRGSR